MARSFFWMSCSTHGPVNLLYVMLDTWPGHSFKSYAWHMSRSFFWMSCSTHGPVILLNLMLNTWPGHSFECHARHVLAQPWRRRYDAMTTLTRGVQPTILTIYIYTVYTRIHGILYIYTVYTRIHGNLSGISHYVRSHTVYVCGSGQPYPPIVLSTGCTLLLWLWTRWYQVFTL